MPDKFLGIIMSSIVRPVEVSRISVNIIAGTITWGLMTGFVETSLGMPSSVAIIRPWIPVICKRNTGNEKYQRRSDHKNFLDMGLHRFSPSIVRC